MSKTKRFVGLEISAAYESPAGDECAALFGVASGKVKLTDVLPDGVPAEGVFYTIYGKDAGGFAEALDDAETLDKAEGKAAKLKQLYGISKQIALN